MTIIENFERFRYFNIDTCFLENENFTLKTESAAIKNATVS